MTGLDSRELTPVGSRARAAQASVAAPALRGGGSFDFLKKSVKRVGGLGPPAGPLPAAGPHTSRCRRRDTMPGVLAVGDRWRRLTVFLTFDSRIVRTTKSRKKFPCTMGARSGPRYHPSQHQVLAAAAAC